MCINCVLVEFFFFFVCGVILVVMLYFYWLSVGRMFVVWLCECVDVGLGVLW